MSVKDDMPTPVVEKIPVAVWIRVSTRESAEGDSPKNHEYRARRYAEMKGWEVVRVYDLSGVSGKTVEDHPECQAMLADVAAGRIKALIFSNLARLARNSMELQSFANHFNEYDAHLVSLHELIDTSTPTGRLFYKFIAALAEWEREVIAERVQVATKVRAERGMTLGGAAPFGYRLEEGELAIDEVEAPIRRRLFEIFRETHRFKSTAAQLNEEGYRTRKGAMFSDTTVGRLLSDPIAKGQRRTYYTESTGAGKHWKLKPEEEWIYQAVPAIVSEELWHECNNIIDRQRNSKKKYTRQPVRLFGGLLYCKCGNKMYKPSKMKKYVCSACRNKMPVADIEKIFVEQLKAFYFNEAEISTQLQKSDSAIEERTALLEATRNELQALETRMEKTYQLFLADSVDVSAFGEIYQPLKDRQRELQMAIPRLHGEVDALSIDHQASGFAVEDGQMLYSNWGQLDFNEKRTVVETVIDRITVGEDDVEIELAYVPYSQGVTLELSEAA